MGTTDYGEAEHECPDESGNLEFALSFDYAVFLSVIFEYRRWKERSEPVQRYLDKLSLSSDFTLS